MWNVYGDTCFSQKIIHKFAKHEFATISPSVEKTVHVVETHCLYIKKKVPGTMVKKEGYAGRLLVRERTHH